MVRKCGCLMGILCLLFGMGIQVKATEALGTLQIMPVWCGNSVEGGTVSAYRVGEKTAEGVNLTDGLANWCLDEEDLSSEYWINWMRQRKGTALQVVAVEPEAGAVLESLSEGIYFVEQTQAAENFCSFQPFFLSIPENGNWDLVIRPRVIYSGPSPKTGDHPAPIIAAMGLGLSAAILMVIADNHKK